MIRFTNENRILKEDINVYPVNEQAITIEFRQEISLNILDQVASMELLIKENPFPGLITIVPAYATLTLYFNLEEVNKSLFLGINAFDKVFHYLKALMSVNLSPAVENSEIVEVPVCYGGIFGPDLNYVSEHTGLSVSEIIDLHCAKSYKIYMIGFVPGFPYLGGMNPRLATPRRAAPRQSVAKGSVGIAGGQTGIYPMETPGGWQIIGRTPLVLFDHLRQSPSLLKAGQNIRFKPISQVEFERLSK